MYILLHYVNLHDLSCCYGIAKGCTKDQELITCQEAAVSDITDKGFCVVGNIKGLTGRGSK